ncbi:MAG: CpsB/CapC family capsule biosynthesis tyrosine phosphatase [bacterium]
MVDIHTHVLPAIDDGPDHIKESQALLLAAWEAGTRTMVATPHVLNRLESGFNALILTTHQQLLEWTKDALPEMQLLLGTEIYFQPRMSEFTVFKTATLNGTGKYMLIEFSMMDVPKAYEKELDNLFQMGITPIIAHPERNALILRKPEIVRKIIDKGGIIQINAGSLLGENGRSVKKMAQYLLTNGWVHCIASDTHSIHHRKPDLRQACEAAAEIIGESAALRLVQENPKSILDGLYCPS